MSRLECHPRDFSDLWSRRVMCCVQPKTLKIKEGDRIKIYQKEPGWTTQDRRCISAEVSLVQSIEDRILVNLINMVNWQSAPELPHQHKDMGPVSGGNVCQVCNKGFWRHDRASDWAILCDNRLVKIDDYRRE